MQSHILFSICQVSMYMFEITGDTENHFKRAYETSYWCAVDFNNLKFISFIKCRSMHLRWPAAVLTFLAVFNVFRITYNKFNHFFFHKYSLKCTALFLDIHVVFNFNFLTKTSKLVIKGNQMHTLSSLYPYRFISSWTSSILGQIRQ